MSRLHLGPGASTMTVKEWRKYYISEAMDIAHNIAAYAFTQGYDAGRDNEEMARNNGHYVKGYRKELKRLLKQVTLRRIGREHIAEVPDHE